MTGHGGWPLTAFLDPEGVPFYGGTYFPPEPRHGMPSFRMVMEAVVRVVGHAAGADPRLGGADPRAARRRSAQVEPSTEPPQPTTLVDGAVGRAADARRHAPRRASAARPSSRPPPALELLLARGETRRGRGDARRDGLRRHLRPARRRLRPLLGRRRLAGSPLREDALRQRAARPRLSARLAGAGARALAPGLRARRSTGRCARCAGPRAASTRRSTPTPRARRAASTSGRRTRSATCSGRAACGTPTIRSPTSASPSEGNFEGRNILHLPGRPGGRAAAGPRRRPGGRCTSARSRRGLAGPRRQAALLLERADDRRARRRRRGARARATTSTPRWPAPSSCCDRAARRRRAPAPHLEGRRGAARTPTWRTTPIWSRRC